MPPLTEEEKTFLDNFIMSLDYREGSGESVIVEPEQIPLLLSALNKLRG